MTVTPKMWAIQQRITFLSWVCTTHPDDYDALKEMEDLIERCLKLERAERLGLRVIPGGRLSNSSTQSTA